MHHLHSGRAGIPTGLHICHEPRQNVGNAIKPRPGECDHNDAACDVTHDIVAIQYAPVLACHDNTCRANSYSNTLLAEDTGPLNHCMGSWTKQQSKACLIMQTSWYGLMLYAKGIG